MNIFNRLFMKKEMKRTEPVRVSLWSKNKDLKFVGHITYEEASQEMNRIYLLNRLIQETSAIISAENGWEETREYWEKKLLNSTKAHPNDLAPPPSNPHQGCNKLLLYHHES